MTLLVLISEELFMMLFNSFKVPVYLSLCRFRWPAMNLYPQIWTVWHRVGTPFNEISFVEFIPSPKSEATTQTMGLKSPPDPSPPVGQDPWAAQPTGIIQGVWTMVILNKRMHLQNFPLDSSHQITTSVSNFTFCLNAFYHVLFPSELVEMMGACGTQCSHLLPQPSSSPDFLTENYRIELDTGHAGGADPTVKERRLDDTD